jgi:hypothetical protein
LLTEGTITDAKCGTALISVVEYEECATFNNHVDNNCSCTGDVAFGFGYRFFSKSGVTGSTPCTLANFTPEGRDPVAG